MTAGRTMGTTMVLGIAALIVTGMIATATTVPMATDVHPVSG